MAYSNEMCFTHFCTGISPAVSPSIPLSHVPLLITPPGLVEDDAAAVDTRNMSFCAKWLIHFTSQGYNISADKYLDYLQLPLVYSASVLALYGLYVSVSASTYSSLLFSYIRRSFSNLSTPVLCGQSMATQTGKSYIVPWRIEMWDLRVEDVHYFSLNHKSIDNMISWREIHWYILVEHSMNLYTNH